MHRLLARQLRRALGRDAEVPDAVKPLIDAVDHAYAQYDEDREMLERSLELSSTELLTSNAELHALFSSLPDLFIRVSKDRRVLGVPGGVGEDINVQPGAKGGGQLSALLVPPACAAVDAAIEALADAPSRKGTTSRYRIGEADDERHFEARAIPLPHSEVMIVIRDATDTVRQARAEGDRREQAARLRAMEEFAYVASHDLRAPLRAIDNLAEWINEDLAGKADGDTADHLSLLMQRVKRMDGLLIDLLDYCQVGSDAVSLDDVDITELVRGVIDMLDHAAFTFDVGELPRLRTARGPLQRVFLNLITNAVKHHDTGKGRIAVGSHGDGELVAFWVEDDGPGIPVASRTQVFQMFQKLKRRDEVEGSGMGLALIQRIVREAGGEISVGDGIDTGTRFTFTWPRTWRV